MNSSSAVLLHHVLLSGYKSKKYANLTSFSAFAEAFPNDNLELKKHLEENKLEAEDVSVENKMDTATLFTKDGKLCMPKVR